MQLFGVLNEVLLAPHFGSLRTNQVVLTPERMEHIRETHPLDVSLLLLHGMDLVAKPDIILLDKKNADTILMIKRLPDTNLNVVIRLALASDPSERMNSIMTFFRLRGKNLQKMIKRQKTLYKAE